MRVQSSRARDQIRPMVGEDWLKNLNLALKSISKRNAVVGNVAMCWGLIPDQHSSMSLVRGKDGSKRQREPKALSVDEFRKVLEIIPEPFRPCASWRCVRDCG